MDNFLGTVVFLLPGVLCYFWLQAFGINPVVKHTPAEFTAVAALLWFPVSFVTLLLFNCAIRAIELSAYTTPAEQIWTVNDLSNASGNFGFLASFLAFSILISFCVSVIWAKWGYKGLSSIINKIRKWRGTAPFSKAPSVWEEVFLENKLQYVEIGRIDKKDTDGSIIGRIIKVSRPFEPERNLCIDLIENVSEVVNKHEISVTNIFVDVKTGICIKTFDAPQVYAALEAMKNATSSLVAESALESQL
jgi:hypothetical protein